MLNAKEILEENLIVLDNAKGKPAQVGYDLSVKSISKLKGGGKVLKDKTIVNQLSEVNFNEADNGWWLDPGTYDLCFWHEKWDKPMKGSGYCSDEYKTTVTIADKSVDAGTQIFKRPKKKK